MENREEERRVPLLGPRSAVAEGASNAGGREEGAKAGSGGLGWRLLEENQKLWKVAGPSICTRFSGFGATIISQAFIGHIGPTELAAYALVSTVLMRFSNGILVTNHLVFTLGLLFFLCMSLLVK
jgi:MATE family multidrug resistance protein